MIEAKIEIGNMPAWRNPSKAQLIAMAKRKTLRGTVIDGDIYVWNAEDDTHYGVHSYLVGYEEEYLGEHDFMIGRYDDMPDWTGGEGEIEVAPGIFFCHQIETLDHPMLRALAGG